jgi:hypothetical protein
MVGHYPPPEAAGDKEEMTETRFDLQQLESDYAPDAEAVRQNCRSEEPPFGELVMAAFDQREGDDEQAMQAMLPHSSVDHGHTPEATADAMSDVESGAVNEDTDRMDGSVDTALLGGTCFPGRAIAENNAQAGVDVEAPALTAAVNSSEVPAEAPSVPTHIPLFGRHGENGWNGNAPPADVRSGRVVENVLGEPGASPEVGVAAAPQPVMNGESPNEGPQSPAVDPMIPPHDIPAAGSAKPAVAEKDMLALRHTAEPSSGAASKPLATLGVDPDTAEDGSNSTNGRSDSGERDVSDEADNPDSGAVEMAPSLSGMRLAPTPFDMTNNQELNEEFSVAGPRDGVLAPNASATYATSESIRSAQLSEVVARFDEHFLPMVKSGGNTFTLRLDPAHLGSLTINCRESENQLTIEVVTESAATREFLAARADEIRDIAERCGFEAPRVDIHDESDSLMQRERERRYPPPRQSGHASGRGHAGQRSAGRGVDDIIRIPTLAAGVLAVA